MNLFKATLYLLVFTFFLTRVSGQQNTVAKSNPMPVYMHYMPWFDTPETSGHWGWHWTMNNKNPEVIDPTTGKREIASHFYPLIGPYASNDPDVLEYHFLLMKYSGIDGILLDWYGAQGSNGDIVNLLRNSDAAVNVAQSLGLQFAVVLEDRFATSIEDAKANIRYLDNNYFTKSGYITVNNDPLVAVFGPITFQQPAQWTEILGASTRGIEFLPLWHESKDAANNADGEYAWVWEDENQDNYLSHLENYYKNNAPTLKTVMGVAYPGFLDYYKEGNSGNGYFEIPHEAGATLDKVLNLATTHKDNFDMLQLATWNDFGEGTIFEPTFETGFKYLMRIQAYTGVSYGLDELMLAYKLFMLRKNYKHDAEKTEQLNQASAYLNQLDISAASSILNTFEMITSIEKSTDNSTFHIYPNPVSKNTLRIKVSGKHTTTTYRISINDLSGKAVVSQDVPQTSEEIFLSTENINKGVYMVNMHLTGKVVATRLIVVD